MGKKANKRSKTSLTEQLGQCLAKGVLGDLATHPDWDHQAEVIQDSFARASRLVQAGRDPREVVQLPPVFQLAFLSLAEDDQDTDQIQDLYAMTADREVKKEAKRILHRFQSRGVAVSIPEESTASILDRRSLEKDPELACYLTPISSGGSRVVWIARYVQGGVAVYQAVVNDQDGLVEFMGDVTGRSRYRALTKEIMGREEVRLVEITYAEARTRLLTAVERSRSGGKPIPDSYLEASGNLPEPSEPAALPDPRTSFTRDSLGGMDSLVQESEALHDLPEFADWVPDEETLKGVYQKLQEAVTNPIAISDQQKIEQVTRTLDEAVNGLLGEPDRKGALQQRLFEMADFLRRQGQTDPSRRAAAAAWQLDLDGFKPSDSPFFSRLLKKVFPPPETVLEHLAANPVETPPQEPEPDPGNLIVTP